MRRVKTAEGQATLADIKKRRRDELEEAQEEGVSRRGSLSHSGDDFRGLVFYATENHFFSARKFKIVNFTSEDSAATIPGFPLWFHSNTSWVSKTGERSESIF